MSDFSLYNALNSRFGERFNPQLQRKITLAVLSHALEDAVLDHKLQPIIFTAFQQARYYNREVSRYRALDKVARVITVYGCEVPEAPEALEHDWFIIVNEPRFKALMVSRELEDGSHENESDRPFLSIWSYDQEVVDYACRLLVERMHPDNSEIEKLLDEILNTPHQPLEQVKFAQDVGNRILDNLERTNRQAISQINRNQQLLSDLQQQENLLQDISEKVETVRSERTILQGELKKLYAELTRSQQLMTETLIEKARIEQRNIQIDALLQQLSGEVSRIEPLKSLEETKAAFERLKTLSTQLKELSGNRTSF